MPPALRIENLWKSYSAGVDGCSVRVWALRGCSLHVEMGERVAVVGSRGAGKTTLFQCIAGTRRPDAGRIDVILPIQCCFSVGRDPSGAIIRMTAPSLLLVDAAAAAALHGGWRGSAIVGSRDVASVFPLVDRVMLLRDGRLSTLARPAVRRVAERPILASGGSSVR